MTKKSETKPATKPMTTPAAARIQRAEAKTNGGGAPKGGFAGRAQRTAAKNAQ